MPPINDDEFERTTFVPFAGVPESPAPDAIGHYLVSVEGAEPGRRIEIESEPLTFGRDAKQARVVFADAQVSRLHARVSLAGGEPVVENLSATNGTYVDGTRIDASTALRDGSVVRMGSQTLRYERRSRQDVERAQDLERDLLKARNYVLSLLPAPMTSATVCAEWTFVPSMQLGGDAFGYDWLDPETFVFYLVDVAGHGVGSAMHSVTVLNVLRQRALPDVDFQNPAQVLASLNDRFQMDSHDGMLFTMWYGVYRTTDRTMRYAAAGHHPAYLVVPDRTTQTPLGLPALMVGAMPGMTYRFEDVQVAAGSVLYLFSDGIFEIVARDQRRWDLEDFLPVLLRPGEPGVGESVRVYQAVRDAALPGPLDGQGDSCRAAGHPGCRPSGSPIRRGVGAWGNSAIVDLSQVDFVASMGIRMLVSAARSLRSRQATLGVFGAQQRVQQVFEAVSLQQIIPMCTTEAEALTAVGGSRD